MKPHKKQTLFGFVGIVMVIFVFKMAGDYRYVTKREAEYRSKEVTIVPGPGVTVPGSQYTVISADCVMYSDGKRDTLTWQILKRK